MIIRDEQPADYDDVWSLNRESFTTEAEADLVNVLRQACEHSISLVAEEQQKIVGHILFTPVSIDNHQQLMVYGLAPMAVLEDYQKQGVGKQLVEQGLDRCRQLDCDAVAVLGHPSYYPRFGFLPAEQYGIKTEWDLPEGVFMIQPLKVNALDNVEGVLRYHQAFTSL